ASVCQQEILGCLWYARGLFFQDAIRYEDAGASFAEAGQRLEEALRQGDLGPLAEASRRFFMVCLTYQRRFLEASRLGEETLRLFRSGSVLRLLGEVRNQMGLQLATEEPQRAAAAFSAAQCHFAEAEDLASGYPQSYTSWALSYTMLGDLSGAEQVALKAVQSCSGFWVHPLQRPGHFVPGLTSKAWHEAQLFPWMTKLQQHWREIREELEALEDGESWPEVRGHDRNLAGGTGVWREFSLLGLSASLDDMARRSCPKTTELLEEVEAVRSHRDLCEGEETALFSRLTPGTQLKPHCGPSNLHLTCHLGLKVPPGCAIRVGHEWRTWEEGRCLVFDDSFEHEVRHDGADNRLVLLVRFWHPDICPRHREALLAAKAKLRKLKDWTLRCSWFGRLFDSPPVVPDDWQLIPDSFVPIPNFPEVQDLGVLHCWHEAPPFVQPVFVRKPVYVLRLLNDLLGTIPCRFNPAQMCENIVSFRFRATTPALSDLTFLPLCLSRAPANGSSSSRSINGDSEKVWIFPFLVLLGVSAYATYEAAQVGNFGTIFRVPDFQSEMCGEGARKAKTFLYFCMKQDSQWVFDEANKSLEIRYPICVERCPTSFNTSTRCYLGVGKDDDANSWDWVQDYPTQPTAFFCRPHRAFSKGLSDDFWTAVKKGPKIVYLILRFYNGWPEVISVSISCSSVFGLLYIISLSKCARQLIWLALSTTALCSAVVSAWYGYCFKTGMCKKYTGNGAEDPIDLARSVAFGIVAILTLQTICSLGRKLDTVGRILEMSCSCIMSSPMLTILPLVMLCLRIISTAWVVYVVLGLYSAEVHDRLDDVAQPWVSGWNRLPAVSKSIEFQVYVVAVACFYCLFSSFITCVSWFVMIFLAQVWYFAGPKFSTRRCPVPRALWICLRYHFGTMVLSGVLHLVIGPLHSTLGKLQDGVKSGNPLASILQTCLSCCLDFYEESLAHLNRGALLDVSLQAFTYFEGANHIADNESGTSLAEEVGLLNTSTTMFQLAGVGMAAATTWFAVAQTLSQRQFADPDSRLFVEDRSTLCIGGAVISLVVATPFMTIFDVVAEAVLFSKVVDRQRNPKAKGLPASSSMILRNCSPWRRTLQNVGLLGVTGFGVTRRRHEKRCKARRAAAAAMVQPAFCELLPRVDFHKDVQKMSAQEMGDMLTVTGAELKALLQQDELTRQEVLTAAFVAWRPGAYGGAPLRVAMVVGPGDSADTIQVQSETLRWGVMTAVLSVDCIDDGFLKERAWGEGVAMMRHHVLQLCLPNCCGSHPEPKLWGLWTSGLGISNIPSARKPVNASLCCILTLHWPCVTSRLTGLGEDGVVSRPGIS
ncbi:ASPH, partial [Symbiodinium sp. KB8]